MPLVNAAYLLAALAVVVVLSQAWRLPAVLTAVAGALAYAWFAGLSTGHMSKAFGTGFGQTIAALGLTVIAAALMAAIADGSGATARLAAVTARWSTGARGWLMTLLGLIAGPASSPAAAFAVLGPLSRGLAGPERDGGRASLGLGLALAAGNGLLLPSPMIIAATAIIGADWQRVLGFGIPAAVLTAIVGAVIGRGLAAGRPVATPLVSAQLPPVAGSGRVAAALVLASLVLAGLLIVQSLGDLPDEPLGGGPARELILGLGRPLTLLEVGLAIMLLAAWSWRRAFGDQGWLAQGVTGAGALVLTLGAAGGLQTLTQQTGMAELLAEQTLGWHWGLALPFMVAAVLKTLQGSSMVAVLGAAGMVVPLLGALGLDSESGRALAVLALGAGAMTVSHINDPFFWLVTDGARLRPLRGLVSFSLGLLLQGLVALAVLYLLAAVAG